MTWPKILLIIVAIIVIIGATWYALSTFAVPQSPSVTPSVTPSPTKTPPTSTSPPSSTTPESTSSPTSPPSSSASPNPSNTASATPNPSASSSVTPAPSVSPVTPTPTPVATATPIPVVTPTPTVLPGITATFNFDTGTPSLSVRQPEPFDQTSNGLTAHFSSPFDFPSAFSVQNIQSLASISVVINSTKFSSLFLWPSTSNRDSLIINFSRNIASISFTFKTAETHDPGPGGTGSPIRLSAYLNSSPTPVGSTTTNGQETPFDTYPEGTLTFSSSGQQFNSVKIDLPFIQNGAAAFIIDNIVVVTA